MQTTAEEAALFREECIYWQKTPGLMDWTIQFATEPAGENNDEAEVFLDCDTRHARITYYVGVQDSLHPSDVALHEILHLLFADMCLAGVNATHEEDVLMMREEHRVIERLLKVLGKLRRK